MKRLSLVLAVLAFFALPAGAQSWQSRFGDQLPLLGHRNWILVVDSAYPEQVGQGIETIETNADYFEVVNAVLIAIKNSVHVRPITFMDAELPFVPEQKAPGVSNFRAQIATRLHDLEVNHRPHQSLIDEVAKDGTQYHVLILKTNLAIPYTSLFIHLDCKYWSAEDERELRKAMRISSSSH
jgi:hypothetical protein